MFFTAKTLANFLVNLDWGSIPGLGISAGGGHGNPLQCSCLGNPRDRGGWGAIVRGVTQSQTRLHD